MLELPNDSNGGGIYGGQNYGDLSGSGGSVGGFSLDGYSGGYAGFTGVGSLSGYQRFSQRFNGDVITPILPYSDTARNDSGAYDSNFVFALLKSFFSTAQDSAVGNSGTGVTNATSTILSPPLPNVAAPGIGVINNANYVLNSLRAGLVPKNEVPNWVAWIHSQLISVFGTDNKNLKQYQAPAISLGQQIQSAADSVLASSNTPAATPTTETTTTTTPTVAQTLLDQISNLINGSNSTVAGTFEAPANLYSVTPNQNTGGSNSMPKILIIVAVIAAAYFLYKKYA